MLALRLKWATGDSMLKYFLIISILFGSAYGQEDKIPPQVSLRMYIGALISDYTLTLTPKFSSYYNSRVASIANSAEFGTTFGNIVAYQGRKGKEFLSAKKIYGAYRNMLATEEVLVLMNLALHEREEQEFINLLSQNYVTRMDNVLFINDSIDNSSDKNTKDLRFDKTIRFGDDLEVSILPGGGDSIDISSNHRKYTDIFKHCFRQIVKNYRINDFKVKVTWKRVEGKEFFLRTPLEIYIGLIDSKSSFTTTYFGDFSHTGKTRSWGLIRENFQRFTESQNKEAYIPLADYQDLKEISLLRGKSLVINNQFIGVQSLREITESSGKELNRKAMDLYSDVIGQIRKGQLKGAGILSAMDRVLKLQPNHLSARIYKELLQKKYITRMSLMNSFFEFEILFNKFKNEGYFTKKKNPVIAAVGGLETEITKLYKVADRQVIPMCKSLLVIIKTVQSYSKSTNTSIQKGIKQKYFKNLRTINLQGDLIIDNQAAIDRIYKK